MKKTDIKVFPVWVGQRNQLVIKVETDEGLSGLGVEFNEELALRQPFKFWEAPHLHKRDGSYTNW